MQYFYVGGYGGFDRIVAAAVKRLKQKYTEITLSLRCIISPLNGPQRLLRDLPGLITWKGWSAN